VGNLLPLVVSGSDGLGGFEQLICGFGSWELLADACFPAERYLELLKESKIRGYLWEQGNYAAKSS
jgi:hypothetical protein